jgi:hypothetical protein
MMDAELSSLLKRDCFNIVPFLKLEIDKSSLAHGLFTRKDVPMAA